MPRRRPSPRAARQTTRRLDQRLQTLQIPPVPRSGWVRAIRDALGMTQAQLAKRMGITQQNAAKLESDESSSKITLDRLKRAADALGCDLEYAFVPRQPLEQMVSQQAQHRASKTLNRVNRSQALEASAVASDSYTATLKDLTRELETQRPADLWDD